MSQVRKDILNGWKEIATYVGRDIRTVERWEKQRGLPIRRVPGEGRATVYAVMTELDRWFVNADSRDDETPPLSDVSVLIHDSRSTTRLNGQNHPNQNGAALYTAAEIAISVPTTGTSPVNARSQWRRILILCLIAVGASSAGWLAVHRRPAKSSVPNATATISSAAPGSIRYSFDASPGNSGLPYPSQVNGVDDIYLHGTYLYEQRRPQTLRRAVECFSEAIAKDPNYAPAFAGLATTYLLQREYAALPDKIAYPRARVAAQRAIGLDPKLPQPHVSMGFIDFFWSADAVSAEREFHRAIELSPSLVVAHHWYGSVLAQEGRYPEALEQLNLAQRLDPTSASIFSIRAMTLGVSGHRSEAVEMLQELLDEVPEVPSPHQMLAILSLVEPHDVPRWIRESRLVATMRNDKALQEQLNVAEPAYRSGGEKAMWSALLNHEQHLHPAPEQPTYMMGVYQALLGNNDAAFPILIASAKRHDPGSIVMNMDPRLAGLRRDTRYAQMFAETHIGEAMKIR